MSDNGWSAARIMGVAGEVIPSLLHDEEISSVSVTRQARSHELVVELHDSARFIMYIDHGLRDVLELAFHMFFQLQDIVAESETAWAQARPLCPGHVHPRGLDFADGELWWRCPSSMARQEIAFPRLARGAVPGTCGFSHPPCASGR